MALSVLAVLPALAWADTIETPVIETISGQYHDGSAAATVPQPAEIADAAATAAAAAAEPASPAPAPPAVAPIAAPTTAPESSINTATNDMQSIPGPTGADVVSSVISTPPEEAEPSRAVASGATGATEPAAGPDSADRPHGGAPVPAASTTPAAQAADAATGDAIAAASAAQAADAATGGATATTAQAGPSDLNVNIRIFSPGNDGPVTQTNVAGADTVSVATTPTAPGGSSVGSAANPTPTPTGPATPTTWVWNWTWESASTGCAPGAAPATPSSTVAGSTWTWTWVWRCAPKLPQIPGFDIPLLPDMPPISAIFPGAGADDDALATGQTGAPAGAPTTRPPPGRLATHHHSDGFRKMWATLGASSTGRGRGGVDSGADKAPAVARATDTILGDLFHTGLTASVAAAAAAGAGGSGPTGVGLGAALLLAAFVLFSPHLLIPLKAAAARRLPHVSVRRDRPG